MNRGVAVALVPSAVLLGVLFDRAFWGYRDAPMYDLIPLYTAASLVSDPALRLHIYDLDPVHLNEAGPGAFRERAAALGFEDVPPPYVHLPIFAWLARPLTWLPWPAAKRAFLVFAAAVTLSALVLLWWETLGARWIWSLPIWLLPLVVFQPLHYANWLGQTTGVVFAALVTSLALLNRARDRGAGVLVGWAGALKLLPALVIPVLWMAGRRRAATWAAGTMLLLGLVSCLLPGGLGLVERWTSSLAAFRDGIAAWNNQSLTGLLLRFTLPADAMFGWSAIATPAWIRVSQSTFAVLLAAIAFAALRAGRQRVERGTSEIDVRAENARLYATSGLLAMLMTPLCWSHYFVHALVAVAALAAGNTAPRPSPASAGGSHPPRRGAPWVLVALVGFALLALEPNTLALHVAPSASGPGGSTSLIVSANFFGGLLLFAGLAACSVPRRPTSAHGRPGAGSA